MTAVGAVAFVAMLAWLWRDLRRLAKRRREAEFKEAWRAKYGPTERPRTR